MTAVATPAIGIAPPRLTGIDHIEWWVGSAKHAAYYFQTAFGFDVTAYSGPETGVFDRTSYVLEQGAIRWVVTSSLCSDGEVARHVLTHGDGVRSVAFGVSDVVTALDALVARGGAVAREPWLDRDDHGELVRGELRAYGDTLHVLTDRSRYVGGFAPSFRALERLGGAPVGLRSIDHVVANVERGRMGEWVDWYARVFGFTELTAFDEAQISTRHSALRSTVVWNGGAVVLPINEPADGLRASQIDEYLDYYGSPGVQHIALATDDIVATMTELRGRGVRFLEVPAEYYDAARERMGDIALPWDALADLGVLVDRDDDGYLLQVFTETVASRPTVFLEIIQRSGARGFGEGNFKALFEAIEREQARRGNL